MTWLKRHKLVAAVSVLVLMLVLYAGSVAAYNFFFIGANAMRTWVLNLGGVAAEAGEVKWKIGGQTVAVSVEPGQTAEQVGVRLADALRDRGLDVTSMTQSAPPKYLIMIRSVREPKMISGVAGMSRGYTGNQGPEVLAIRLTSKARWIFDVLNAESTRAGWQYTTEEFYNGQVVPVKDMLAQAGEKLVVESIDGIVVEDFNGTATVHVTRARDGVKVGEMDVQLIFFFQNGGDWMVTGWDLA